MYFEQMFMRINSHLRYQLTIIYCGHGVNMPVNIFLFSDSVTAYFGVRGEETRGEKRTEVLAAFQSKFKINDK